MNNPFKPRVEITSAEERRLNEIHRAFLARLEAAPEERRKGIINTTAWSVLGYTDPLTRSVAKQMHAAAVAGDKIASLKSDLEAVSKELAAGGYRPSDPHWRGRLIEQRDDLAQAIDIEAARALALRNDDHQQAREEAVLYFREEEAKAAKQKALLDAVDRLRSETEARETENRAREVLGLKPLDDAE